MIDTAGTLVAGAQAIARGGRAAVYACATHPVFSGAALSDLEASVLEEVVVCDTIPVDPLTSPTRCGCSRSRGSSPRPSRTSSPTTRSRPSSGARTSSSSRRARTTTRTETSMERVTLEIEARETGGSPAARALRRTGMIPGVLYGNGRDPHGVLRRSVICARRSTPPAAATRSSTSRRPARRAPCRPSSRSCSCIPCATRCIALRPVRGAHGPRDAGDRSHRAPDRRGRRRQDARAASSTSRRTRSARGLPGRSPTTSTSTSARSTIGHSIKVADLTPPEGITWTSDRRPGGRLRRRPDRARGARGRGGRGGRGRGRRGRRGACGRGRSRAGRGLALAPAASRGGVRAWTCSSPGSATRAGATRAHGTTSASGVAELLAARWDAGAEREKHGGRCRRSAWTTARRSRCCARWSS